MTLQITAQNKQEVVNLIRSVVVCLDIIRTKAGRTPAINYNLLNTIDEVLLTPEHSFTRLEIVNSLDFPTNVEFLHRYTMFKQLSPKAQAMTKELVQALRDCDYKFLQDLKDLVADEDPCVRFAVDNLLTGLIPDIEADANFKSNFTPTYVSDSQTNTMHYGPGYYGGYSGGYYGGYSGGYYGGYSGGYSGGYYGGYYGGYSGGYYGGYSGGYYGGYSGGYYGGYSGGYYGGYSGGYYGGYYGYGNDGYGYGYLDIREQNVADKLAYLHDEELLEVYQTLRKGIRNTEGQQICIKPGFELTGNEARSIVNSMKTCEGDHQQRMFCGIADVAMRDDQFYSKLQR